MEIAIIIILAALLAFMALRKPADDKAAERILALERELAAASERQKSLGDVRGTMLSDFKALAAQLLDEQRDKVVRTQAAGLGQVIEPFKAQLGELKAGLERGLGDMKTAAAAGKASLDVQLDNLMKAQGSLSKEAAALTDALRGRKKLQGNWAEIQIERLFEILGFEDGREYSRQEHFSDGGAGRFTDYILNLPGGRRIIIDAKMSLNSYQDFVSAEDEAEKRRHLRSFVEATKRHVEGLSSKNYQDLVGGGRFDYVFMFMPLEHAYIEALREDEKLYDFAFRRNVAIVTPSLLLPMMRTIDSLWKIERQNKNVERVAELVKSLYEKYAGFTESFKGVGDALGRAQGSYDNALKQLSTGKGNMSGLFDRMRKLGGVQTSKTLAIDYDGDEGGETESSA
ncbi:MAG: DNA recombination protein RmuC [Rickettsiales bacterium]|jgi:DNA recombination protein RmuC|nr:DNA recombination protein RmuC [Rickettsiales bacterium]